MFRIGEFSKMSNTTIKTLRYYDEVGLLKPEAVDRFTGYRLYTTEQLVLLHRIQSLRQIGLSIEEISRMLSGGPERAILKRRREEILTALSEYKSQLSRIEFILSGQEEELFMNYSATIKELPACTVYSKRMTVPDYNAYFQLIPAIGRQVAERYPDLKCAKPEYCFITYLDIEYREKDIRVEFSEAVTALKPDFEDIKFKKIPAVTAVSVFHRGSYAGIPDAYAFAMQWIEKNGCLPVGSPRENYIDGIWNKESESEWLTEIQIPIAEKREAEERYGGTDAYRQSAQKKYTDDEKRAIQKEADEIFRGFAEIRESDPAAAPAQALVRRWQAHVTAHYYDCGPEILAALGQMYVGDARFAENLDRFGEEAAAFMGRAIAHYCHTLEG